MPRGYTQTLRSDQPDKSVHSSKNVLRKRAIHSFKKSTSSTEERAGKVPDGMEMLLLTVLRHLAPAQCVKKTVFATKALAPIEKDYESEEEKREAVVALLGNGCCPEQVMQAVRECQEKCDDNLLRSVVTPTPKTANSPLYRLFVDWLLKRSSARQYRTPATANTDSFRKMRRKAPRATILYAVNPDKGAFPLLMTLPYENYNNQTTSTSGTATEDTEMTEMSEGNKLK
ncbi:unnamed protein product [Caenorhabditis sp. 36 PRJEB53466]|nr:unnamed protein product [Caenorhabditis sp. 36 PRJEB53466]